MKVINEHIKSGEYSSTYLIYGEEDYLKRQYKDKLKEAIIGEDTINYSYYEDKRHNRYGKYFTIFCRKETNSR